MLPKSDKLPDESKDDEGDKNEQEMYKLRAGYYKGNAGRAIRMVSEVVTYKADAINNTNGHLLGLG